MSFYSHLPLEELTDVVTRNPDEIELRLALVEQYARISEYSEALDHAIIAKRISPTDAEVEAWMALSLIYNQLVVEGHDRLQRVVRNNPCCDFQQRLVSDIIPVFAGGGEGPVSQGWMNQLSDNSFNLPDSFREQNESFVRAINAVEGDAEAGIEELHNHLECFPEDINARLYLAITLTGVGRIDDSIEMYRQVIRLDDRCASAYFDMAAALDDLDQSIELTRKGLQLCPFAMHARYNLGMFLMQRGDMVEARRQLTRIPADSQVYTEAVLAVGMSYEEQGDLAAAVESLERAICLAPERADIRSKYGQLLSDCGLWEEAAGEFQQAIQLDENQYAVWVNKGLLHLSCNDYELAEEAFRQALDLNPSCDDAAINLAVLISAKGDHVDAIQILLEARQHHPQHPLICQNLGAMYCHQRELDLALEFSMQASRLGARSAALFWNLANIHCLRSERQQCLENLGLAIQMDDDLANQFQQDIDFEKYWTDPEFLALIHD